MSETPEDFLEHFGVKGMKWGKRKARDVVGRVRGPQTEKAPASADAVKVKALKKTAKTSSTDALSNDDLQAVVNRMNLERQYKQLKAQDTGSFQTGLAFVSSRLGDDNFAKQLHGLADETTKAEQIGAAIDSAVTAAKIINSVTKKR